MENFRSCPICLEVPDKEIFQCSAGHVICHSCMVKVDKNICPQCRIPFGNPNIRNRALEEILDTQDFPCKFKDNGCSRLFKREELTTHGRLCFHNPETFALCQQMGIQGCSFRLGCASKREILLHFQNAHNIPITCSPHLLMDLLGKTVMAVFMLSQERKLGTRFLAGDVFVFLICTDSSDTSPLFLIHGKWNNAIKCWSLACIKLWESGAHPTIKYSAEFSFIKDLSPIRGQFYGDIPTANGSHIFPFGGSMTVCSIKEAPEILETSPINIPNFLLEKNGFGSRDTDKLLIKIRRTSP